MTFLIEEKVNGNWKFYDWQYNLGVAMNICFKLNEWRITGMENGMTLEKYASHKYN